MKISLKRITCIGCSLITSFSSIGLVSNKPFIIENTVFATKPKKAKTDIVYITKFGKRYHRAGCKHLKHSCTSLDVQDAKSLGYTPCNDCSL